MTLSPPKTLPGFEAFAKDWPLLSEGFQTAEVDSDPLQVLRGVVAAHNSDAAYLTKAQAELNKWTSGTELVDAFRTLLMTDPKAQSTTTAEIDLSAGMLADTFRPLAPTLQSDVADALAALDNPNNGGEEKSSIESFFTQETAGLPMWAWFAIGFAALLLLIIIIAAIARASRKDTGQAERAEQLRLLESRYPPLSQYPNPYQ